MKKGELIACLAILATALAVSPAHATVLAPGGGVTVPDAGFGSITYSGGTVVASYINEAATFDPGTSGTLTTEVIKEAAGTYDFLYQITATSTKSTDIHQLTATDFAGPTPGYYATNVQFGTAGAPFSAVTAPVMYGADRSTDGSTIGWTFTAGTSGGIAANGESYVMIVKTNATSYTAGSTFAIDGGMKQFKSFAPSGVTIQQVPELSTMALAGLGAMGMIGYSLRRRKALGPEPTPSISIAHRSLRVVTIINGLWFKISDGECPVP